MGGVLDAASSHPSRLAAHNQSAQVAHCGACGECSTVYDIIIYNATRNTLTTAATKCALKALVGGRLAVAKCFDIEVGFTAPCRDCWVDNVMCDQQLCLFTCIRSLVLGESKNVVDSTTLNRCLECDERRCGHAFAMCAGANRRRCGVISDIGRDSANEICTNVDPGWPWSALSS